MDLYPSPEKEGLPSLGSPVSSVSCWQVDEVDEYAFVNDGGQIF